MHTLLHNLAAKHNGLLDYGAFTQAALYHPELGYYTQLRSRVGKTAGDDFYTASSLGPVFGKLLLAACDQLLGSALERYHFVEIGAEANQSVFGGLTVPFARVHTFSLGDAWPVISAPAVVFSNELFDAQPFHRLIFKEGAWHELGVHCTLDAIHEVVLPSPTEAMQVYIQSLPCPHIEGYKLDVSPQACQLVQSILTHFTQCYFLAFDYGYSREHLLYQVPYGTARAYYRHQVSHNLLERIGEQDLTYHVCWDDLINTLKAQGCTDIQIHTQGAFFTQYAQAPIASIIESPGFHPDKQTLKALLFPQHMGRAFQVLHAASRDLKHSADS